MDVVRRLKYFKVEFLVLIIIFGICLYRFFRDVVLKVMLFYKKAVLFFLLLIVLEFFVCLLSVFG